MTLNSTLTLSIMTIKIMTLDSKCCYAESGLCWVSRFVIMLSVVMLNVMAPKLSAAMYDNC